MLLLGRTGSGKSSLCNVIAGHAPNADNFPVSSSPSACTTGTKVVDINFGGDSTRPITIIDTIGFDENPNHLEERIIADIIVSLKNKVEHVNVIGLVINGNSPRLNATTLSMLTIFENIFGDCFWKRSALIFTNVSMDANSRRKRMRYTGKSDDEFAISYLTGLKEKFPIEDLRYFFLDACYNEDDVDESRMFLRALDEFYSTMQSEEKLMTSTLHGNLASEYPRIARFISSMEDALTPKGGKT